ncbi:MAG: hypothetical protein IIB00_02805 [candidate division Zixibacteria bacterium]|nr:hypothetical protein [candidate division Zixibacteria bacterium]
MNRPVNQKRRGQRKAEIVGQAEYRGGANYVCLGFLAFRIRQKSILRAELVALEE